MSIQVIDVSEQENDGSFGVFVVTLQDGEKLVPVLVWYSLAEDRVMVSSKNLTLAQGEALAADHTVKEEMREAVMAERDGKEDQYKAIERKAKFEARVAENAANLIKWSTN